MAKAVLLHHLLHERRVVKCHSSELTLQKGSVPPGSGAGTSHPTPSWGRAWVDQSYTVMMVCPPIIFFLPVETIFYFGLSRNHFLSSSEVA